MLKLTLRRFAAAGLAAVFGLSGAVALAQLAPTDAPPRSDTPRSNTSQPEADSRAGGALSEDAEPIEGAEIVDGADIRAAAEEGERKSSSETAAGTVFTGLVTGVADGRISVKMTPPRSSTAIEQVFKVSTETAVLANGQSARLSAVRKGDFIRITATPGDPEVAMKIVVATPPRSRRAAAEPGTGGPPRSEPARAVEGPPADEDRDPNFDAFPDEESAQTPPPGPPEQPGDIDRRVVPQGDEEAVLPLGIEVYVAAQGTGALVTEMLAGGPAANAGVLIGDMITEVNRRPIGDPELIEELLSATATTGGAELTVLRDGEVLQLAVQPARIVEGSLVTFATVQDALAVHGRVGTGVVLPFGATRFADFDDGGVVVTGTRDRLLGGLLPNDVIIGLNGQTISDRAAFLRSIDALPATAETLGLTVLRNGERVDLDVPSSALNRQAGSAGGTRSGAAGSDRERTGFGRRPLGPGAPRSTRGIDLPQGPAQTTPQDGVQEQETDETPATGAPQGTGGETRRSTGGAAAEFDSGTQPQSNVRPSARQDAGQSAGQTRAGQAGGGTTEPPQ